VLLDGRDLRDLELRSLRENMALLLQETLVFDGTVRENIAYGRPEARDDDVLRAAELADAHDFISGLPGGYDAMIGQKGRRLSGGQRQRIAIARAMIRDAPVLILDEPTAGVDSGASARVLEPLRRLISGRATLIISHNLMTVREADGIVVLDHGREVEGGSDPELMAAGGLYARLYRLHRGEGAVVEPAFS
jgi:ATP-binding cassette, subfamily B, bacterial